MNGKKTVIITISIILILIFGLTFLSRLATKLPQNSSDTIGNTAGNLNNGGYFCEADNKVYFANAYDDYTLYSMNPDQTEITKLGQSSLAFLNKGGNYLYYYQKEASKASGLGFLIHMSGIYRCKTNGKNITCLDRSSCNTLNLIGNTLYYEKAVDNAKTLQLYAINTDKSDARAVAEYLVNPASAASGVIYYNGTTENHYLYSYDTQSGTIQTLFEYNMWYPTLSGSSIYYLDTGNNYQLCRYDLTDGSNTVLTTDRVDLFNVAGSYVYYQKNDPSSPALMRMGIDGSNPEIVAEGNYSDINVTSSYVYFHSFGADTPVYQTSTYGPISVMTFDAAKAAALQAID